MVIVHCPFCLGSETKPYLVKEVGTLRKCLRCSGIFNQNRLSELEFNDAGSDIHKINDEYDQLIKMSAVNQLISQKIIDVIFHYLPMPENVLEIGCGTCAIGMVINKLYSNIIYRGIEISERFYRAISPEIKKQVIFEKNLFKALDHIPDNSQNTVILNHVLEHLPYPREILDVIKQKLLPSGGIYLEVPNEQWKRFQIFVRRFFKSDSPPWFPGHINFFTQDSLRNFVMNNGMKLVFLEKGSVADNFPTFVKMLGGEDVFNSKPLAKLTYTLLRFSRLEKLVDYGIVLRCICKKITADKT
jgi:ubiquinone/menaquinone biosynthesis C-methylase UbiE